MNFSNKTDERFNRLESKLAGVSNLLDQLITSLELKEEMRIQLEASQQKQLQGLLGNVRELVSSVHDLRNGQLALQEALRVVINNLPGRNI